MNVNVNGMKIIVKGLWIIAVGPSSTGILPESSGRDHHSEILWGSAPGVLSQVQSSNASVCHGEIWTFISFLWWLLISAIALSVYLYRFSFCSYSKTKCVLNDVSVHMVHWSLIYSSRILKEVIGSWELTGPWKTEDYLGSIARAHSLTHSLVNPRINPA